MATKKKVPAKKAVEKPLLTVLVLTETGFIERFTSVEEAVASFLEDNDSPEDIEGYSFFQVHNGEIVPVKNLKVVVPTQKVEITYNV
jgi:hypothetical protein